MRRVSVSIPELHAPVLRPDVLAIARRAWEDRTRSEYIGVMILRRFHGLLADLNAPTDLQEMALAIQLQEQQHANLCMAAARSLGSDGAVAIEVEELQQSRTSEPLEEQLMDMLVGTFLIGERVALALLEHAVKQLPANGYQGILKYILRDEVLHGRLGPPVLRAIREGASPRWLRSPGDDWIRACVARHVDSMRRRDVVEPDEAALFLDPVAARQLESVGIPNTAAFKEVYLDALRVDVPTSLREAGFVD